MNFRQRGKEGAPRFGLRSLMLLVALLGFLLWATTQYGMTTVEYEILDVSAETLANDQTEISKITYRVVSPEAQPRTTLVFLDPPVKIQAFEFKKPRQKVRFRETPLLWVAAETIEQAVLRDLQIPPSSVNEVIHEYGYQH